MLTLLGMTILFAVVLLLCALFQGILVIVLIGAGIFLTVGVLDAYVGKRKLKKILTDILQQDGIGKNRNSTEQHTDQILNSIRLIQETSTPATFFMRYDYALERAMELAKTNFLVDGKYGTEYVAYLKDNKVALTNRFLDRCFCCNKENQLKEKELEYLQKMPQESQAYYKRVLRNPDLAYEIKGEGEYLYCTVKFRATDLNTYCYLADKSDDICTGDYVYVMTKDGEKKVHVIEAMYYTRETAPYPVDKTRWIMRKA